MMQNHSITPAKAVHKRRRRFEGVGGHSGMLRLDATPEKMCLGFDFKFKNFCIKQAIFIRDIFPSHVKAPTHKKN